MELLTNTAVRIPVGPLVDPTDGKTIEGALTVADMTVEIEYIDGTGGGAVTRIAFTPAASGSSNDMVLVTSSAHAIYDLELTAANVNWLGSGKISFYDVDGFLVYWDNLHVVSANYYNNKYGSTIPNVNTHTITADAITPASVDEDADFVIQALSITNVFDAGSVLVDGTTTLTGHVLFSDGIAVAEPSTLNRDGISVIGNGTGDGVSIDGGDGATGNGVTIVGNSTNAQGLYVRGNGSGAGLRADGGGTGNGIYGVGSGNGHGMIITGAGTGHGISALSGNGATGNGINAVSSATNGSGIRVLGTGSGDGMDISGGATGHGISAVSGGVGDGIYAHAATTGHGLHAVGGGVAGDGINADGGTDGDGITAIGAGVDQYDINADIQGTVSGTVAGVTPAAAGAEMDLIDAPNANAITAIQSGLAPANEYDTQLDVNLSTRATSVKQDTMETTLNAVPTAAEIKTAMEADGGDLSSLMEALVNKRVWEEAGAGAGTLEIFNDAGVSQGTIANQVATDGTYTTAKRAVI